MTATERKVKLASFEYQGADRAGVELDADTLLDLSSAFVLSGAGNQAPRTVQELIEGGDDALVLLHQGLAAARTDRLTAERHAVLYSTAAVHWRAPGGPDLRTLTSRIT